MARAATLPSRAIAAALGAAGGLYAYLLLPMLAPTLVASTAFQFFVSAIVVLVAAHYRTIWDVLRQAAQWVANSRRDWLFFGGRFRVVNHSLFACAAGAVGTYLAIYVIGSPSAVLLMLLCGLVGAALFAQAIWGNK